MKQISYDATAEVNGGVAPLLMWAGAAAYKAGSTYLFCVMMSKQ
ncbi:hypothetical protein [Rheinheimera pleomorphica]|nr:hypothetical protein [Rheinheimera pleomorphica]